MNPIQRKITLRGVAFGGASLVMLMAGMTARSGELITLSGCGLLIFGASFFLARINLGKLELKVEMPARFFAKRAVQAQIELANQRKVFNAWGIGISMRFPGDLKRHGHAAWTPSRGSSLLRERVSISGRAVCSSIDYELRSGFPFGFFEMRQAGSCDCPLLVYPQLIAPLELQLSGRQADHKPSAGAGFGDMLGEPRGIRPYQAGDKAARIHQFASARSIARGQGLQVRASDPPGFHPERCRIVFHSLAAAGEIVRPDRFERALSLTAGTLAHFQAEQTKLCLQADFNDWQPCACESRAQYFECLALLTRAQRASNTRAAQLAALLQRAPKEEQLIIISDTPPQHWANLVPASQAQAILIDIRQVRFKRRQLHIQLAKN